MKFAAILCCLAYAFAVDSAKDDNTLRFRPRSDIVGEHWALLVAGSSGWYNYRHQADICHAYQVLRRHGFPSNRIITMMFDDIADNTANPTPGEIINHPNGRDVYAGVKIDYSHEEVTPENFLAVLSGDASTVKGAGSGRVINRQLNARVLMETIKDMHQRRRYKQMVIYIEACESGSMLYHLLPKNINGKIYVIWVCPSFISTLSVCVCLCVCVRGVIVETL
ncbi:hypothetical protein LSH36_635g01059 [Paralvinella palmiformis]|uniref:Legumain n=1 Tax=Paralvinella palmiformis TaxID=53620 RepID=A0AAD9MUM1_9ANNE|nr:hypothetical protein LSH36_635g01059 [Paralvinella palmiformis]